MVVLKDSNKVTVTNLNRTILNLFRTCSLVVGMSSELPKSIFLHLEKAKKI